MKKTNLKKFKKSLGTGQEIRHFIALKDDLLISRDYSPIVSYEIIGGKKHKRGDILSFVKGLRLSARLIYILRKKLSDFHVDINWGHIQDDGKRLCSPECDIIIHKGGISDTWNGDNDHRPVMDFHFIQRDSVKAVISCKSMIDSIDDDFALVVRKEFKINNLFIFAEAAQSSHYMKLKASAKKSGYKGLWTLYNVGKNDEIIADENEYLNFLSTIKGCL